MPNLNPHPWFKPQWGTCIHWSLFLDRLILRTCEMFFILYPFPLNRFTSFFSNGPPPFCVYPMTGNSSTASPPTSCICIINLSTHTVETTTSSSRPARRNWKISKENMKLSYSIGNIYRWVGMNEPLFRCICFRKHEQNYVHFCHLEYVAFSTRAPFTTMVQR